MSANMDNKIKAQTFFLCISPNRPLKANSQIPRIPKMISARISISAETSIVWIVEIQMATIRQLAKIAVPALSLRNTIGHLVYRLNKEILKFA